MRRIRWSVLVAGLLVMAFGQGCRRQAEAPPSPPPPEVAVVTVEPRSIVLTTELPGRTSGYLVADVRPQVSGLIQKRLFTEGSDVKAGDVLYRIDPAPFQAAHNSALANLDAAKKAVDRAQAAIQASTAGVARQEATVALAKTNLTRMEDLYKDKAVSESQRDQAATDVDVAQATLRAAEAQVESDRAALAAAQAAVQQAEAALETTRINLAYTEVTAPIPGRIGRSNVTEGAIVTAYQAVLATIQAIDPIYVDVPQSTAELTRLRRALENGRIRGDDAGADKVKILLEDGTEYPLAGTLQFRDISVDPTTASVILRIVVPNPDGLLLPGMFVRAVIEEGVDARAILIPQQAVSRDQKGNPLAMVVDGDGKVQLRGLGISRALGDAWLVTDGLAPGDRVIVEGIQKARPGATVRTVALGGKPAHEGQPTTTAPMATKAN